MLTTADLFKIPSFAGKKPAGLMRRERLEYMPHNLLTVMETKFL